MSLPSTHALLRRSFLRLVLVIGLAVTVLFSLGIVVAINRFATPTQNAKLLSSIADYENTLQPMLANADPALRKKLLAILRESAFITLAELDSDAKTGELAGYSISLQLLQNSPASLVQWIDQGVRYDSERLTPIGPVPEHWRSALRGRTRSIVITEPEGSPLLQGELADAGLETLLVPITDERAVAVMSPTRALGHWYGLGSFGWTVLLGAALVTVALLLPAMLLAGVVARRDAPRLERPLAELAAVAERYLDGAFEARVRYPGGTRETELLGRVLNELGARLQQTLGMLEERNRELDVSLRTQQRLFTDVSHDLRTPLAALLINAELAQQQDPGSRELHVVVSEAGNLRRLVEDIFAIARLGSGQLRLDRRSVVPDQAIGEAVAAVHAAAKGRSIDLHAKSGAAPAPSVWADPQRLGQVLRNLLGNAIRHTGPGGQVEVQAAADPAGTHLRLEVRDTGEGIRPEDLPRVFERFWRADQVRPSEAGERSTGLGLAIVKALVEAMGGDVGIESTPGIGTRVWFTLPLAPRDTG